MVSVVKYRCQTFLATLAAFSKRILGIIALLLNILYYHLKVLSSHLCVKLIRFLKDDFVNINQRLFALLGSERGKRAALARKLDLGTEAITNWERRGTDPPAKYVLLICEFLKISPHYLITGEENDNESKLSEDEKILIERYRLITNEEKELIRADLLTKVIKLRD